MREYPFELPQQLSGFITSFIPGELQQAGIWDKIPTELQEKIANSGWTGIEITQEDLDPIDDETWESMLVLLKPYL